MFVMLPLTSQALSYLVDHLPYWAYRRTQVERAKLNFDLAIDCNGGHLDPVKQKSVF
jgi:hypothetical protein